MTFSKFLDLFLWVFGVSKNCFLSTSDTLSTTGLFCNVSVFSKLFSTTSLVVLDVKYKIPDANEATITEYMYISFVVKRFLLSSLHWVLL